MALKLMYITNDVEVAEIAEDAGVDRILIDLEYIGKSERQKGMNTVQSHHRVQDIQRIRPAVGKADLMIRVNPIHEATSEYVSSEEEINAAVEAGADILMLPYFKTCREAESFLALAGGRVRTSLLVETPEAVACLDDLLRLPGVDEIHIGINDLSIGYGKKFMFELLSDGTVEAVCKKCRDAGIPYGFGGIASLGKGLLPSEYVIREHYRLGSTCAILSRSFCNLSLIRDRDDIRRIFQKGVREIREFEEECRAHPESYEDNRILTGKIIREIVEKM